MNALEVKGIKKSFKGFVALSGVDLVLKESEYLALLGPNGAGKTTLIEIIEGIQKHDAGEVFIKGLPWNKNEKEIHSILGISFQDTRFFDRLSVRETLSLFASFYKLPTSRVGEIIEQVGLGGYEKKWTSQLSGGMRQKLALSVALLNKPEILLLDEPSTGLDPSARRDVWDVIKKLKSEYKTSMILTTHYMEEAEQLCDRIVMLHQGAVLMEGTLDQLLKSHPEAKNLDQLFLLKTGRSLQ